MLKHLLCPIIACLVCLTGLAARGAEEPVEIERALVRHASEVIQKLKEKGYKNVGVLKFLAVKDGGTLTDNVGTLNLLLAQRLAGAGLDPGQQAVGPRGHHRERQRGGRDHSRGEPSEQREAAKTVYRQVSARLGW